jgi:molybdopterin molybdotransferase
VNISLERALEIVAAHVGPVPDVESIDLASGYGRVLAGDVVAPLDVPGQDTAAMDGYAFAGASIPVDGTHRLTVIATVLAGRSYPNRVREGQCVRIMTGAPLPTGVDTVVMQEDVQRADDIATFGAGAHTGEHVRRSGDDIAAGARAIEAGTLLDTFHIGLLAALGCATIDVVRRPRVAFFCTGDELRDVGERLDPGQTYDSNRYTLNGLLQSMAVEVVDLGVVKDTPDNLERALMAAAAGSDAVITSGGVSVGDADFLRPVLSRVGTVDIAGVAMKPGRPVIFARVDAGDGDTPVFALPGNPVALITTFHVIVRPALRRLMGISAAAEPPLRAICQADVAHKPGRREFHRAVLARDAGGDLIVTPLAKQGSARLTSMTNANSYIVITEDDRPITRGVTVPVIPFTDLN